MSAAPLLPRWFLIALAAFLAAVAAVAWWVFVPASRAPLDEKLAELRAAGFALDPSELPGAALPDDQNGAGEFEAAWQWVLDERGPPEEWNVTGPWAATDGPWYEVASPEQRAALGAWLDASRPFFDRLDAALARPALRWDTSNEANGRRIHRVQWIVVASAEAASTPQERLLSCLRMFRIGERMGSGTLMDVMFGIAAGDAGRNGLRRLAQDGVLPAATLRRALEDEHLAERVPQFGAAARGEIAHLVPRAESLMDGSLAAWGTPRHRPADVAQALEMMRRVSEVDMREYGPASERVRKTVEEHGPSQRDAVVWPHILERCARFDSGVRLLRVALAATERRERDGFWPRSLEELAPELDGAALVDPLWQKPFVYEVRGRSAMFLSNRPGGLIPAGAERLEEWTSQGARIEIRR